MGYVKLDMTDREYDEWLKLKTIKEQCDFALCLYAAKVLRVEPECENDYPPEEDKWEDYSYSPDQRDSWIAWALVSDMSFDCKLTTEQPAVDDDIFNCTGTYNVYHNLPWAEETIFIVYIGTEQYCYPMIQRYDLIDTISGFDSAQRCMDAWA